MDRIIQADLYRNEGLTGTRGLLKALWYPGFRFLYILRKLAKTKRYSPSWVFYQWLRYRYSFKYGFQISSTVPIGEGLYIPHPGMIVINGHARIGKNCNIGHCVTIGQTNRGPRKGCPTIGDRVWIGAGSVLVGKITIGSDVLIAPNSYVNMDIPPKSLVMGNPCRIIPKENPCEGYINYLLD